MCPRNDPRAPDESYGEEEEPNASGDSLFPHPPSPYGRWLPFSGDRAADHEGYEAVDERGEGADEDDGSSWDEGLITLLIVVGVVLFLFPEPATSAVGILLISVGVVAWLIDWMT